MEKVNEPSVWLFARRMLIWGFVMACLWGCFPFFFGGQDGLRDLVRSRTFVPAESELDSLPYASLDPLAPPDPILTNEIWLNIFGFWAVAGFLTGALAGYLAPKTETLNPLKSSFFRSVGQQTFWTWFWSSIAIYFLLLFSATFSPILYLIGIVAGYIIALNRALKKALALPKVNSLSE